MIMALLKTVTLPSGVVATYHRVTKITGLDFVNLGARVTVESYVSEDSRRAGATPIPGTAQEYFLGTPQGIGAPTFPFTTEALEAATPQAIVYAYLKTLPEFAGAEDC